MADFEAGKEPGAVPATPRASPEAAPEAPSDAGPGAGPGAGPDASPDVADPGGVRPALAALAERLKPFRAAQTDAVAERPV